MKMQSVSSRTWTRIAVFISYGDNDYNTGTSTKVDGEASVMVELSVLESTPIVQIEQNWVLTLNCIVWNRTVLILNFVFMLNWIIWKRIVFMFNSV